jgi:hypothetical protein
MNEDVSALNGLRVFTNKETASILKMSLVTLWRLRKARKISYRRIAGKIVYSETDIKDCLDSNKHEAKK